MTDDRHYNCTNIKLGPPCIVDNLIANNRIYHDIYKYRHFDVSYLHYIIGYGSDADFDKVLPFINNDTDYSFKKSIMQYYIECCRSSNRWNYNRLLKLTQSYEFSQMYPSTIFRYYSSHYSKETPLIMYIYEHTDFTTLIQLATDCNIPLTITYGTKHDYKTLSIKVFNRSLDYFKVLFRSEHLLCMRYMKNRYKEQLKNIYPEGIDNIISDYVTDI